MPCKFELKVRNNKAIFMDRQSYLTLIENHFRVHSVCALLGPRQVGKTTLAKMYIEKHPKDSVEFFDLENPLHLMRLSDPLITLQRSKATLIVIDEVQLLPDLFKILRVLVDEKTNEKRYLILGSASRDLIQQSSETLAGRVGYIEVMPFSLLEVPDKEKLWKRGGFPRSYLAITDEDSFLWRQSYISTFLERDIPSLGFQIPPIQMRRFWMMLCHYHGQMMNLSELSRSLAVSDHMIRKYLDILVGTFMVRSLTPWFENLSKRQIKTPKIYFRDNGILFTLLGLQNESAVEFYPKLGSFWEGFALEEIIREQKASPEECFFWGTQGGAELDLLIIKNGKRIGFEFKYSDVPKLTASMKVALEDLKLDHLYIVYPGLETFSLAEKVTVKPLY